MQEVLNREIYRMIYDLNNKIKEQDGFYPMKYVCKYMEQEAIHLTLTYILGARVRCIAVNHCEAAISRDDEHSHQ